MQNDLLVTLRRLTDAELVAQVKSLVSSERATTARLVAHLAELDTRDVHLRAGYSSLFTYCRDALGLSEHEAYNRIEAARAVRRFPVILRMLCEGSVHVTTVRLLAPHLTPENHRSVLESARGRKKTEVEEIVARLSPRPDVPASVRKLKAPARGAVSREGAGGGHGAEAAPMAASASSCERTAPVGPPAAEPLPLPPVRRGAPATAPTPLSDDRYKVQFTIGGETLEKLRLAKDMLRHPIPSGDEAAILDRALTALLADLARKKFAATEKPRPSRGAAPGSRHVPAEVKRAVWLRDLGRCAFVGAGGRRCSERAFLEFHHAKPYAAGGEATVPNIQLRCRRPNGYEARAYFGQRRAGRRRPDGRAGLVREKARPWGVRPPEARHPRPRPGTSSLYDATASARARTVTVSTMKGRPSAVRIGAGPQQAGHSRTFRNEFGARQADATSVAATVSNMKGRPTAARVGAGPPG